MMIRAKPKYYPDPRVLDEAQVAARLGRSVSWLHDKRARLEAMGFPRRDDFLGGRDADAIELWFDAHFGMVGGAAADHAWLEAIND